MEINSISIIGSGNMAWAYAHAFYAAGFNVQSIISRNNSAARKIANQVGAEAYSEYSWTEKSDLIVICISDDAIAEVANKLEAYAYNKLVIHSAGAQPKALLNYFNMHGVLWPVQTITKGEQIDWVSTPLIFDANDPEAAKALRTIATKISNHVEMRNDAERKLIHLAAVWANNFSNHMYTEAKEVLDVAKAPFSILMPIIKETVQKLENQSPKEAQTGPAKRNDINTLEEHGNILRNISVSKSELYRLISERINVTNT